MLELIREGSKDPELVDEARRATRLANWHDHHAEIQSVWDYMTGLTSAPYRLDPVDAELLQGATVPSAGRDCDCMVIKSGALFEAIGHPVEVVIAARRKPPPGKAPRYGHTWLRVLCRTCRRWHDFDPVLDLLTPGERAKLGQSLPHEVVRRFRVSALGYTEGRKQDWQEGLGLQGLNGFSLKKLAKGVAKVATSKVGGALLKSAVSFVPGGQAALTALNVASKGVQVLKAVKQDGVKGLVKAAAPLFLDRLAPGASQVVKAVTAKVPAGALKAAAAAVKQANPKLAQQAAQAARVVTAPALRAAPARPPPAPVRAIPLPPSASAVKKLLPSITRAVAARPAPPPAAAAAAPQVAQAFVAAVPRAVESAPSAPAPIYEAQPQEEEALPAEEQAPLEEEQAITEEEVVPGADPFEETADSEGEY